MSKKGHMLIFSCFQTSLVHSYLEMHSFIQNATIIKRHSEWLNIDWINLASFRCSHWCGAVSEAIAHRLTRTNNTLGCSGCNWNIISQRLLLTDGPPEVFWLPCRGHTVVETEDSNVTVLKEVSLIDQLMWVWWLRVRILPLVSHIFFSKEQISHFNFPVYSCERCNIWSNHSVVNAIRLLQVCIYKAVNTGLFLTTLVALSQNHDAFARQLKGKINMDKSN